MHIRFSALLAMLVLTLTPVTTWGQSSLAILNQDLQAAVHSANWTEAIQILDQMRSLAPQRATEFNQYRSQLQRLQSVGAKGSPTSAAATPTPASALGDVAIKRRQHGVPVVDVTFNRRQKFEMLVDSGASLTVITRPMARALGITSEHLVGNITVSTANGVTEMPLAYVNSIEVGGLTISQVEVAISGPDMDMGLLGQDFLQHHDVVLRQDRIHFRPRAGS
jgi:aspartyl protease family protein